MIQPLLKVENLCTYFKLPKEHLLAPGQTVFAVDGVTFSINSGETFGLVGESGCGKSTTALSVLRLVQPTSGAVIFKGLDVLSLGSKEMRVLRRSLQMIFQDPYSSLNPRATAEDIVSAPLKIQNIGSRRDREKRVAELFRQVGLSPKQRKAYPHQFSGGQRQRIGIARALASNPEFIVCDEPVSALDVAIQAQILNLLLRLQRELNLTYLFISHDMAVIQHMCDTIAVMYLGRIVEQADRLSLFRQPLHPYTQALLLAVPTIDFKKERVRAPVEGDPPNPMKPPVGCHFHPRCPKVEQRCRQAVPELREVEPGHFLACHQPSLSLSDTPESGHVGAIDLPA